MTTDICMNFIKKEIEEKGYIIIPDVLNNNEIIQYIDEFNKWMDSVEQLDHLHNVIDYHGIFKYYQVGHQRFAWLVRTNPKIINIFKSLWNTDELVVSFDGCCYYPKEYTGTPSYWIHSDQSSMKKNLSCIQSFISLTSNKQRTLVVYEGSHKLHEDHSTIYNIENPSDWYPIEKEYIESIQDKKRTLKVEVGSLVLWDSRTFHQNTCGESSCNEERLIQYLCYLPKNNHENNEKEQFKRNYYFITKRTTNHFPYPMTPISLQPNTYNYYNNDNYYIDYNKLPEPNLNDLLDKIYKLL